jgi:enoyl-CoA hydratase/carnithine racemase
MSSTSPGAIEPEQLNASLDSVSYEVDDRLALITLDRPEKMNSLSVHLQDEFQLAIKAADANPQVRVVVIRGAGSKAFTAGYDITGEKRENYGATERRAARDAEFAFATSVWRCSKPTIAMVNGYCLGGGVELALLCDMRYASDDATFGVVETRFSGPIVAMIMPWVIGQSARELIFTGDQFGADRAHELGLVDRVFPKDSLERETLKIARRISQNAQENLRINKRAINAQFESMGFETAMRYAADLSLILDLTETPEARAFAEVRAERGLNEAIRWRRDQYAPFE